jgi:hypothetical protein
MKPENHDLLDEDGFNRLAVEVFHYQVEANPIYGSFVRGRAVDLVHLEDWKEIPALPTAAFREMPLGSLSSRPAEAIFRTSGTSHGQGARGVHAIHDLSLYRDSLIGAAKRFLLPAFGNPPVAETIKNNIRFLFIAPGPEELPDSSLLFMFGAWMREWDDGGGRFLADSTWRIPKDRLRQELEACSRTMTPVLLGGTAFSFALLLDEIGDSGAPPLPIGSVVVETGGFKGRVRSVPRPDLYRAISRTFGIPTTRIVNEYGMTELLSQFYEPVLLEGGPEDPERRRHLGPPWVRTLILDPYTLEPSRDGDLGILCHMDLANLDSVSAILTDDLGHAVDDGFRIMGRAEGAEARGCSLIVEELARATQALPDK